ncbi:MAG: cell division protein ZapA [Syntrophothermus sp.]
MSRESNMAPTRPEKVNRVKVKISGEEYTIKTEASAEHVEKVAALVDKRLKEAARALPTVPLHRLAIFVALNLADELVRCEGRSVAEENSAVSEQAGKSASVNGAGSPERGPGGQPSKAPRDRFKNPMEDRL